MFISCTGLDLDNKDGVDPTIGFTPIDGFGRTFGVYVIGFLGPYNDQSS